MVKPKLKLLGTDSNAFAILAEARKVAQENNMDWQEIEDEASDGDYNHLLRTMMKHFEVH